MLKYVNLLVILLFLTSCTSIDGIRDKSSTIHNYGLEAAAMKSMTILPIKDDTALFELSANIEAELFDVAKSQLPMVNIVDPNSFRTRINKNNLLSEYTQWRSTYEETRILSLLQIKKWALSSDSRYCLFVNRVNLSRIRMLAVDTGYSGWVHDVHNQVWRTDLRLFAQVIDTMSGTVLWEGVGHAENINSKDHYDENLTVTNWNAKGSDLERNMIPMVKIAVNGLIANMISGSSKSIRSETTHQTEKKKDIFADF